MWRVVDDGVEVSAFRDLPDEAWAGIDEEVRTLRPLLTDRGVTPYARYGHWWSRLSAAVVRRRHLPLAP